ncbi:MAG: hypothetical protein B7Y40_06125 [Gammaproteobacteria bacterium 28-57-27]|nr:MAG: hypothetical protein B7Y40_06125 [Gammaproteobacteria bacterium 28-57-27]
MGGLILNVLLLLVQFERAVTDECFPPTTLAGRCPQHGKPEPRTSRGFSGKKKTRRLSGSFCV